MLQRFAAFDNVVFVVQFGLCVPLFKRKRFHFICRCMDQIVKDRIRHQHLAHLGSVFPKRAAIFPRFAGNVVTNNKHGPMRHAELDPDLEILFFAVVVLCHVVGDRSDTVMASNDVANDAITLSPSYLTTLPLYFDKCLLKILRHPCTRPRKCLMPYAFVSRVNPLMSDCSITQSTLCFISSVLALASPSVADNVWMHSMC